MVNLHRSAEESKPIGKLGWTISYGGSSSLEIGVFSFVDLRCSREVGVFAFINLRRCREVGSEPEKEASVEKIGEG